MKYKCWNFISLPLIAAALTGCGGGGSDPPEFAQAQSLEALESLEAKRRAKPPPPPPPESAPLVSTLQENFEAPLPGTKWVSANVGTGAVSVSNGVLDLAVPALNDRANITTVGNFKLQGSSVYVKVARPVGATGPGAFSGLRVIDSTNANNYVEFQVGTNAGGTHHLQLRKQTNGVNSDIMVTSAWTPAYGQWVRMREASGILFLETAPDTAANPPTAWTQRASMGALPSTFASAKVRLLSEYWNAGAGVNQSPQFDGLNIAASSSTPPPPPPPGPVINDGTAQLNAMFNASLTVTVPPGTYMINGPLNVRQGHVIQASPNGEVRFKAVNGYGGQMVNTVDRSYTIKGITFDGNYQNRLNFEGNNAANIFNIVGGSNVTLENNRFEYTPSHAIWTYRSASIQVRGNHFVESYMPIRMDANNLNGGTIENNTMTNTAAFASFQHLQAINHQNIVIRGNTMTGVGLKEPAQHDFEGTWGNSIYLYNCTGHLIEGNTVGGNWWSSVVSGMNARNGIIRNNTLNDGVHTYTAIWIEMAGAEFITVDDNEIGGAVEVGDTGGNNVTITNNTIRSRHFGVNLNSAAKNVLVENNHIISKSATRFQNGIYLWDKSTPDVNVRVFTNHIEGFDHGIGVERPGNTGNVYGIYLSGNTFANNNINVYKPAGITANPPLAQ